MKHKHKYKHNKTLHFWQKPQGRIAIATTITGCCAVGYIVSLALAMPQQTAPKDTAAKPEASQSDVAGWRDQSGAVLPTPTPGSPEAIAAEAAKQAAQNAAASTPNPTATPQATPTPFIAGPDLFHATKKEYAMQLVSSAENSSLNWKAQYAYIEDIGDGRGYTAGIIGFCSGTGDMLEVVRRYASLAPGNALAAFIPALESVNGSASHAGLDPNFTTTWQAAANDQLFQQAQNSLRDDWYFNPAVSSAKSDGVHALGQFIYYDAMVMHGQSGFDSIRAAATAAALTPAQGGDETSYLHKFLDARKAAMLAEPAHSNTTRVDTAQRVFLNNGNLNLNPPLNWHVYGDSYTIN